jgi:hypothetical protein
LNGVLTSWFDEYDNILPTHVPAYPTGNQTIDYLNEGYGLSNFFWHGSKTGIGNRAHPQQYNGFYIRSLDDYDIGATSQETGNGFDSMHENGKYSISYLASCNAGAFDKSTNGIPETLGNSISMAESFTTYLDGKGGPAMIAYTNSSRRTYSNYMNVYFHQYLLEYEEYHIGMALSLAKIDIHYRDRQILMTNLFGDPEMEVWTEVPEYLEVQQNLTTNTVTVTSNGVPVANAEVYFASEDYNTSDAIQFTDANGIADSYILSNVTPSISGVYEVLYIAKDFAGNKTTEVLTVVISDSIAPVIVSVTGNPTNWVFTAVTLTVNATDNSVGTLYYSFDNGSTWSTNNMANFPTNQIVNIKVKDFSENVVSQAVTINKIDDIAPVITLTGGAIQTMEVATVLVNPTYTVTDNSGIYTVSTSTNVAPLIPGNYTFTIT